MSATTVRNALPAQQRDAFDAALAGAGQVYAEGIARQDARSPRQAALAALGRHASESQIAAWISEFRPSTAQQQTA